MSGAGEQPIDAAALVSRAVDFHTHAFPDELAERAIPALEAEADVRAFLDGRLSSLLASMDRAGIRRSVVASVATRPAQFRSILDWSESIASDRIIPFPSFHPDDPDALAHLDEVRDRGLKGVKIHPYYQRFELDETRMHPFYRRLQELGLILLIHAGFDIAFERSRIADPVRILRVTDAFPELTLVAAHFGAWDDWDEMERHMLGRPLYMDISFSLEFMDPERAGRLLREHPPDHLLFGTDSPWGDQSWMMAALSRIGLDDRRRSALLYENAERLLGIG